MFGIASRYVKAKKKALLSILYLNMEVWRLPSNHDQAKDAWPNIKHQPTTNWGAKPAKCTSASQCPIGVC
jgi:hypothetical protein